MALASGCAMLAGRRPGIKSCRFVVAETRARVDGDSNYRWQLIQYLCAMHRCHTRASWCRCDHKCATLGAVWVETVGGGCADFATIVENSEGKNAALRVRSTPQCTRGICHRRGVLVRCCVAIARRARCVARLTAALVLDKRMRQTTENPLARSLACIDVSTPPVRMCALTQPRCVCYIHGPHA